MWPAFDVKAVLKALQLTPTEVAAGAMGLGRRVNGIRLALTTEQLRLVHQGDLIVTTTGALDAAHEPPTRQVELLDAAEVAGLVVRVDAGDHLATDLLMTADRVGVPIVPLPAGIELTNVIGAITETLLEAQNERLQQVLSIQRRFAQVVAAGGGPAEVVETLHHVLRRPVGVFDAEGHLVVASSGSGLHPDLESPAAILQPIRVGATSYGTVIAEAGHAGLDEDAQLAMEQAAWVLAIRVAQATAAAQAQEGFESVSLEELISGASDQVADVVERASAFGWDLHRPRAVLLASIDPPADGKIPAGALATIAAAARATLGGDAIIWTRSTTIAALVAPVSDDPGERRDIAERLRAELDSRVRSVSVSIGVGRRVRDAALLTNSFNEASRSVEVGRWAKGRHVTEVFDQLGLERLLAAAPIADLVEFVTHTIGPLVEHDRDNGSDLVATLEAWLATRNMAEAARRLAVHYNTLKNRLDRIEAIIGPVLTSPGLALDCDVAIYVARHYDIHSKR